MCALYMCAYEYLQVVFSVILFKENLHLIYIGIYLYIKYR